MSCQVILNIREFQEQCFRALFQAQQEDRELFRSWINREIRAAEPHATPAYVSLTKRGPQDDPEAFIDLFEKTAEAFRCCPRRRKWPPNSCQSRTSWIMLTWSIMLLD